jgi:hypothetical protein
MHPPSRAYTSTRPALSFLCFIVSLLLSGITFRSTC